MKTDNPFFDKRFDDKQPWIGHPTRCYRLGSVSKVQGIGSTRRIAGYREHVTIYRLAWKGLMKIPSKGVTPAAAELYARRNRPEATISMPKGLTYSLFQC